MAEWLELSAEKSGEFQFLQEPDFSVEFNKHKIDLFENVLPEAAAYFNFLNELSTTDKQNLVQYFSEIEPQLNLYLKEAGLSAELKYLPLALSFLNYKAAGEFKKAGLWQLTHFQAVLNGLQVNRLVDERFNAELATQAAAKQIKTNLAIYKSEERAVLAFLVGNAKMKNTLARCREDHSLENILSVLPENVSETIAIFQAASVFFRVNKFTTNTQKAKPDTVLVSRRIHFKQVAESIDVTENELKILNPQYHHFIVPGNESACRLLLPNGKHDDFVFHSDSIFFVRDSSLFEVMAQKIEYPPAPNRQYVGEKVKDLEIEGKTKLKYRIQSGDVLGFIAEDFDVRVADLKYWNNIYNERKIQAGKTLDIFVDDDKADHYRNLPGVQKKGAPAVAKRTAPVPIPLNARKIEHTVKNGESPYIIAKKYNGVSPEAILDWNHISDARKIQIGQKLTIYLQ